MERSLARRPFFVLFILLVCSAGGLADTWYDNETIFPNNQAGVNHRSCEHFRLIWGKGATESATDDLIWGNTQMLEQLWHQYHDPQPLGLGFHIPDQPIDPALRDGKSYRANLILNNTGLWEGGAWGSVDAKGLPMFALPPSYLRYDPPSGATPHEYAHTVLINAGGFNNTPYDGMWHEATANWLQLQFLNSYPETTNTIYSHACSLPHGRDYYDSWMIWEYLGEEARYGYSFINTLWTQAHGSQAEYIFDAMVRLHPADEPDPYNAIKDVLGHTAEHCVAWDFRRGQHFRSQAPLTSDPLSDLYRRGYSELIREAGSDTWYRIPWEDAPSQGGFDIIPIALAGKQGGGYPVTVHFRPLWDGSRGADWRACFVAVNDRGEPRYSRQWNCGTNTLTLSADENRLYLVVTATPDFRGFDGGSHPLLSDPTLQPQAFEIAFVDTQAGAYESVPAAPNVAHTHHPNGGGFVANTAWVDPYAYVGPHAMVLGNARVNEYARLEDYAVVRDTAQVRDRAVVSGHALVRDSAQVYGNAKVRDWATVRGSSKVYDNGKVLERAHVDGGQVHGNGVVKGYTYDWGDVKGYALKDGDCANGATVDHQVLLGWVWGTDQAYADSRPDTGGLYCHYSFEKTSPVYALDTFGVIHGYLMGGAEVVDSGAAGDGKVLSLDGVGQYVELRKDVSDFREMTIALWARANGGQAGQMIFSLGDGGSRAMTLTPDDGTGRLTFTISNGTTTQVLAAPSALVTDAWTHVALTFSNSQFGPRTQTAKVWTATGTLYVNGAAVATQSGMLVPDVVMGANTVNGGNGNYLGRGNGGGYFCGQIDDWRVYARALTEVEIANLAAAPPQSAAKLIAWYPFDETSGTTAADASGNGRTGTLNGNCAWTRVGKIGNALDLKGASGYVSLPAGLVQDLSSITVAAWVRLDCTDASSRIFDFGTGPAVNMFLTPRSGASTLRFALTTNGSGGEQQINAPALAAGDWTHVAVALSGSAGVLYVHGAEVARNDSLTLKPADLGYTTQNWIGRSQYADPYLDGRVDDFRIYDGAMSPGDIMPSAATAPAVDVAAPIPDPAAFLVAPKAVGEDAITMSAIRGTDAGKCVEYYFACTNGPGHDSGWISSSRYTDCDVPAGSTCNYTVQMRDGLGNTTAAAVPATAVTREADRVAPTPDPAAFAVVPTGISPTAITMTATRGTDSGPLVEYLFTRVGTPVTSGWQSSPTWTDTGLTSGATYSYTVQMRDQRGNLGAVSAAASAGAVDRMPPTRWVLGEWEMLPYVKLDGGISMTARAPVDDSGSADTEYYFHCVNGGLPDSGWTPSRKYVTRAGLAPGTYSFQFKLRDKSAQRNESEWSSIETAQVAAGSGER